MKLGVDVSLACACMLIVESSVRTKNLPQAESETETSVSPAVIFSLPLLCVAVHDCTIIIVSFYLIHCALKLNKEENALTVIHCSAKLHGVSSCTNWVVVWVTDSFSPISRNIQSIRF